MNYQKVYNTIIDNAKSKNRIKLRKTNPNYVYYESHHIVPKCLNGIDDKENLVLLTGKEHFICHKLLTYMYKGNRKIALAFHKMSFGFNKEKYRVSSNDYQYARELIAKTQVSTETKEKISKSLIGRPFTKKGLPISNEHKEKISNATKGKNNPMFGKKHTIKSIEKNRKSNLGKKHSDETKSKMKISHEGLKHTEETKLKFKKSWERRRINYKMTDETKRKIGIKTTMRLTGKKHSEETKKKQSLAHKGKKQKRVICKYCGKECSPSTLLRWHDNNCKFKV